MKKFIAYFKDGKFEELMGCLAIAVVIVPVIINIINRSFLNRYSTTIEAVALFAYVWIGYGFYGYLYKKDAHVDVKFLVNKMSPVTRAVFDIIRDIFILIFSVFMLYWGSKLMIGNMARYSTGTKIPMAIGYAAVVFGSASSAIRSFWALVRRFFKKQKKEETKE
ncbi:MAG: TRAP transporter small permease [Oscillibacter sp.]|jgi:TRAP-type C4-dicarboxylate transport system permease small subunit|nr:TRAP transporter small permease [Oscillibacter sp.]